MTGVEILHQVLLWQLDRFVPYEALVDVLWGEREDGGPLKVRWLVLRYIRILRKRGEVIETWWGVGARIREKKHEGSLSIHRPHDLGRAA